MDKGNHSVWSLLDVAWAQAPEGMDGYLDRMLRHCAHWFKASGVSIFLRQENTDEYLLAGATGTGNRIPADAKIVCGEGLAGLSVLQAKPMLVHDPREWISEDSRRHRRDLESAMVIPLVTPESGAIGVLNVSRQVGMPKFQDRDLRQAASLARHLALAVGNARLFAQMNAAAAEARALSAKLQTVLDNLGVGILVISGSGVITDVNPEAVSAVGPSLQPGCSLHEALGTTGHPLAVGLRDLVDQALDGKRCETRAFDQDSNRAWSAIASPMAGGGATVAVHEVTEHDRALRELSRMKRLAEIGQMTAAIAHEIRNPLTGMRGAAQMIQQCPEHAEEFAGMIEEEVGKLNSLCDEFLEFARPLSLDSKPIRLPEVVSKAARYYESAFREKGVEFRLETGVGMPTMEESASESGAIMADPLRVEQVVHNLVRNALDASAKGGSVRVVTGQSALVVQDNGIGMSQETIERLFTPFFTTKASGTGLGLSNVRKIVDAHGGSIRIESEINSGTTFTIDFSGEHAA